jgi:hypothetical protein
LFIHLNVAQKAKWLNYNYFPGQQLHIKKHKSYLSAGKEKYTFFELTDIEDIY